MLRSIREIIYRLRARLSLGHQIAIFTGALSIVLVAVAALFAAFTAREQSIARIEVSMSSLAASVSDRLAQYMRDRLRDLTDVAAFEPLADIWTGDSVDVRAVLEQMQESFPAFTWIGFAQRDGRVAAATDGLLEGASVAERPWFVHASTAPTIEDVHDAKLLANLLTRDAGSDPFRFVDVAVPVKVGGRATGVLGAHLSWSWADELRRTILSRIDPRLKTDIWILERSGTVLLGPPFGSEPFTTDIIAMVLRDGRATFIDHRGGDVLTSAYLAPTAGTPALPDWIVVARRPLAFAYGEANEIAGRTAGIGLALAVLGIGGAMLAGLHISRPLRKLTARVDLIGRDPNVTTVRREHGSREVVQLSSAIRSLLLRAAHAEGAEVTARRNADAAEQRMEERTRSLGEHIRSLQTLADTDSLTGLLNRRAFLAFATDAMNYFRRHGRNIGILVIDIDFFKRVNDTYGHAFGDVVIEEVARRTTAQIRTTDKAARFGGEEFVVLLRETDIAGATALAERIREAVAGSLIADDRHDSAHVTISIGLAMAHGNDRDVEDVIERADRALYRAKQGGRNRVIADTDTEPMIDAAE